MSHDKSVAEIVREIVAAYRAMGKQVTGIVLDKLARPTGATFSLSSGEAEFHKIDGLTSERVIGEILGLNAAIQAKSVMISKLDEYGRARNDSN